MVWGLSILLGVGLLGLWLAGIGNYGTVWLSWLDFVAGVASFVAAFLVIQPMSKRARAYFPILLGIGIAVLWAVGLATQASRWLVWSNLWFSCAFVMLGLASYYEGRFPREGFGAGALYDEQFGSSHQYLKHGAGRLLAEGIYPPEYPGNRLEKSAGEHVGRGPRSYRRSDARIEEDVNERLTMNGQLDATHVLVNVTNGIIILSGNVRTRRAKRLAEAIAEGVFGVKDVRNELHVEEATGGPVSSEAA